MRRYSSCWLFCLGLCCSSCETEVQQKAAVPVTPAPVVKPAPIVVPQTVAQLPDPQPVPPESIPPRPPVEYQPPVKEAEMEVEAPQDQKPVRTPAKALRPARRPPADVPATEVATPQPPVEETPATPAKLSGADQTSVSKDEINATLSEVQRILKDLAAHPQTAANKLTVTRIHSFVRLAEQSTARNDLRQGDILARRALALARDLIDPK